LLGLSAGGPAWAARWQDVMSAETDSVVFLMANGELVKAPFHLGDREPLWTPRKDERISRLLTAPGGGQVAWLSRAGDRGPTALWVGGRGAAHPMMTFPSLVPGDYGSVHFEPAMPTVADPVVRGARLVTPGPIGRGISSNAFEWTIDGRSILCGSGRGLIQSASDTGMARLLSEDRVIALRRLTPSPIYLAHLLQPQGGSRVRNTPPPDPQHPQEGGEPGPYPRSARQPEGSKTEGSSVVEERTAIERRVLLYLVGRSVRLFDSSGLDPSDLWTASFDTVWWIQDNAIHAVRAQDPMATVEVRADAPIAWLEYDPQGHALHWIAEGRVSRRLESAQRDSLLFDLGAPVRRVITPPRGTLRALVTDTQLVLWDLADGSRRAFEHSGLRPSALLVAANGKVFVTAVGGALRGAPLDLYRLDFETGRLEPVRTPAIKGARVATTPSGNRLILYRPGSRPPSSLQVFDPGVGDWTEVENPGVVAWEPLGD
jgi:hypothetical protein